MKQFIVYLEKGALTYYVKELRKPVISSKFTQEREDSQKFLDREYLEDLLRESGSKDLKIQEEK